ncbi:hypothetical protein PR003_g1446 [Phytophthora rubi]|uniref:Uncharacterized protein n=1 Tax=Phytophthora rubi TaxID=129364 RepID=A0A6A4G3E9_9STRA|nr:hypothetical protein PR002_g263 [Phytophthora rubi]KAE9358125.1 hypothetical protein PR003_g1446 [Phytophthora rubi]
MSSDYTANYFFEIDSGVATKRRLVTTEEAAVAHHSQIGGGDPEAIRRAFLKDRFGNIDLDKAAIRDGRLNASLQSS